MGAGAASRAAPALVEVLAAASPRHGSGQPRDADAVIVLATASFATAGASLGAPALVKAPATLVGGSD
jgi:hypothetical protein